MQTYEFRLTGWWRLRLLTRHPLVRTNDRVEAAVVLVAVLVTLAALPLAGALGTAMHDARARAYAEQALTRHSQTATATGASYTTDARDAATTVAPVRWQVDATHHNGEIAIDHTVKAGDPVEMWVDRAGNAVEPRTPATRAAYDAAMLATMLWFSVAVAMSGFAGAVRARLASVARC